MQRVKRAAAVLAVAAAAALTLTSCGASEESFKSGNERAAGNKFNGKPSAIYPHNVNLPDGRTVLCVWEKGAYSGGLSCDWSNAK
ncbi:hypothetical protein [Prescottella equi]|uniref:hypothetical protein n=1 Tax=Rhodococcus hoagii TaxID=43767 RepID=UPI000D0EAB7E|nr:hypothetical protein [Prescottella equi]AVP71246.1 hypothetical protein C7H75_24500 [Prescottella equi]